MGPVPLGERGETGKAPSPWEAPSPAGGSARAERELQRLGGEPAATPRQTEERQPRTEGPCHLAAVPRLRCEPAGVCRDRALKRGLQRTDPGRGLRLATRRHPGGDGVWYRLRLEVCAAEPQSPQTASLFARAKGGAGAHHGSLFLSTLTGHGPAIEAPLLTQAREGLKSVCPRRLWWVYTTGAFMSSAHAGHLSKTLVCSWGSSGINSRQCRGWADRVAHGGSKCTTMHDCGGAGAALQWICPDGLVSPASEGQQDRLPAFPWLRHERGERTTDTTDTQKNP